MFLNQSIPTFPTIYTFNDIVRRTERSTLKTIDYQVQMNEVTIAFLESMTDGFLTTYTKKLSTFNKNMAEDAKKFIETGSQSLQKDSK